MRVKYDVCFGVLYVLIYTYIEKLDDSIYAYTLLFCLFKKFYTRAFALILYKCLPHFSSIFYCFKFMCGWRGWIRKKKDGLKIGRNKC